MKSCMILGRHFAQGLGCVRRLVPTSEHLGLSPTSSLISTFRNCTLAGDEASSWGLATHIRYLHGIPRFSLAHGWLRRPPGTSSSQHISVSIALSLYLPNKKQCNCFAEKKKYPTIHIFLQGNKLLLTIG